MATPDKPEGEAPAVGAGREPGALPEIDFSTFIMSLGSSVLVYLGEITAPGEPPQPENLPLAKQTIEILGTLSEKTRGNLTGDEAKLLEHLLLDLRMKYVQAKKRK